MTAWYALPLADVLAHLKTDPIHGLTSEEAAHRLLQYGPNELPRHEGMSPLRILAEQFTSIMVILLLVAAAISAIIGDKKDTIAIVAIVLLNAALGFIQEYRAEKAMAALRRLAVPTVKARRGGRVEEISARTLVPGDVILLETGDLVPADGRLLEAINLQVQESALTGESVPVDKVTNPLGHREIPVADQRNMVFMGTAVTYGRGVAVVTETGQRTQLGRVATMLQEVAPETTPLQGRMAQLGRGLAAAAVGVVIIFLAVGLWRGEEPGVMLMTAISMAVAAVPEGLPTVVTITLALGTQRLLKRRALIRKLPAVETLGSVTVICSDKTGTLTQNRMTVTVLDIAGHTLELSGQADSLPLLRQGNRIALADTALPILLVGGAVCNDAIVETREDGQLHVVGDPTEAALVIAAANAGYKQEDLNQSLPRLMESPFTSERKRMTTVHEVRPSHNLPPPFIHPQTPYVAFTKGAVDSMLDVCTHVWVEDHAEALTPQWRQRIVDANNRWAQKGMRVLGVGWRWLNALPPCSTEETLERDITFIGLVGMIDPPRPEAIAAVRMCKEAGIRPIMITGDHPLTAMAIAQEMGIAQAHDSLVNGQELARMTTEELEAIVDRVAVYARVSPEHKLKVVTALQKRGHVVAMTGDGVNDAPALRKADIGVAMGITGTDVSKEAADMILLDDNFATIVAAVEEGRVIYSNIRKFLTYLTTSNAGEIWTMLLGPFVGLPLPLLPLQILWINLVTDGPPALALTQEKAEPGIMRRPPIPPGQSVFANGLARRILWTGALMAFLSLAVGYWHWSMGNPDWQTLVFTTLTFAQLANVLALHGSPDQSITYALVGNRLLTVVVALITLLQMAILYSPPLQGILKTVALGPGELAACILAASLVFIAVFVERRLTTRQTPA